MIFRRKAPPRTPQELYEFLEAQLSAKDVELAELCRVAEACRKKLEALEQQLEEFTRLRAEIRKNLDTAREMLAAEGK